MVTVILVLLTAVIFVSVFTAIVLSCIPNRKPGMVWVDPTAPDGGDGTQAKPFNTLQQAMDCGAYRVFLKPGQYSGVARSTSGPDVLRWLADVTAWWKWDRHWPYITPWRDFRVLTQRLRREGKQVYIRGWRARWGN